MKILVTGGAGFIGSCFIRHMLTKYDDYQIINYDALTYCGNLNNLKDIVIDQRFDNSYQFICGDIRNYHAVMDVMKEVDCVVNFAAESHVDNSISNPSIFFETNVMGTANLLQAARGNKIERFLQISTDEVYGSLPFGSGYFDEHTSIAPNSPYSASKASADLIARSYFHTFKLPVLITRCTNNYGPYQHPEKLIPKIIYNILKGKSIPIYGNGKNVRDWIYVYDHCEAIDAVLHNGKIGEIYCVGSHNEKTNVEIAELILSEMKPNNSYIEYVDDRPGHDQRYAISHDKITEQLGWKPSTSFEDGIKKTIKWYIENIEWLEMIERSIHENYSHWC